MQNSSNSDVEASRAKPTLWFARLLFIPFWGPGFITASVDNDAGGIYA